MSETKTRLSRAGEVFVIPFNQIEISEDFNNGRIDLGNIDELAKSIESSGLKIPLLVKKVRGEDKYILMQGKRRYKAIQELLKRNLDFKGVKCFLTPKNYGVEESLFDQISMNDGKEYTKLEQGIVFKQLSDRGYNKSEIAEKIGKSVTHVSICVDMASLPKKVRDMIAANSVSGLTAIELFKTVQNEDELIEELNNAVENAPVDEKTGSKKKVTNKNVKTIATASPMKKLEAVKNALKEKNVTSEAAETFFKLYSRLKAGESVENIVELFLCE
jgi:ParB/RepB/Spo0J family partition protein